MIKESRGLYTPEGHPLLVTPSPAQRARIATIPRVEYFTTLANDPVRLTVEEEAAGKERFREYVYGDHFFAQFVANPLCGKIREDLLGIASYKGVPLVGLRGTAVSLDGSFKHGELQVTGIEQIMREGVETGEAEVAVDWRDLRRLAMRGDDMVLRYILEYSRRMRKLLGKTDRENAIFPGVLAYDLNMLDEENRGYYHKLPESSDDRAKCVLKAYLLDYPTQKKGSNIVN
jgi:hypothetical protein